MRECWAKCLGGCSGLSREHVATRAVFGDGPVFTSGFRSLPEALSTIDALCARVLCSRHNNALSELDAEVVRFARVMQDLDGDANQNRKVVVDGFLLERWCLKYLLGVHAAGWSNLRFASAPETLVRETFGLAPIPGKRGIYLLGPWTGLTGLQLGIQESMVGDETGPKALAGAAINICGALFYLSLTSDRIPQPILDNPRLGEYDISSSQFVFHPLGISLSSDSGAEIHVSFDWTRARS